MRKIIKVTIQWECGVCKEKYPKVGDAAKCEQRNLEKKRFAVGDCARSLEQRYCNKIPKKYYAIGIVTAIKGPKPSDSDYEARCLGGKNERLNAHVSTYIVDFTCPCCDEKRQCSYYSSEISKL